MEPMADRGPLPRNLCWFGRIARGMNMKDLSIAGNMYRGGASGSDIRTGLSRRRGGRWSGSFVYCFTATPENTTGVFIGGKNTRICTLAMCFSVDIVRLMGVGFCGHVGIMPFPFGGPSWFETWRIGRAGGWSVTASCISWVHGALAVGSEGAWNCLDGSHVNR